MPSTPCIGVLRVLAGRAGVILGRLPEIHGRLGGGARVSHRASADKSDQVFEGAKSKICHKSHSRDSSTASTQPSLRNSRADPLLTPPRSRTLQILAPGSDLANRIIATLAGPNCFMKPLKGHRAYRGCQHSDPVRFRPGKTSFPNGEATNAQWLPAGAIWADSEVRTKLMIDTAQRPRCRGGRRR
jgi:hypothetical protein